MDADMEGGKWNCLRCHEFGFIAKGFLYKKGERLDPDHRSVVRRPLFGSAPKTFEPTIPAVAHIYSRIMDVYPGPTCVAHDAVEELLEEIVDAKPVGAGQRHRRHLGAPPGSKMRPGPAARR
jgi:hypothetical protein